MKKIKFLSMMMLAVILMPLMFSCSKDDDGGGTGGGANTNTKVVVNDDGTTSNGSIFSAIDDKNFYLDYIKYTVKDGHLVVSGYDPLGFKGVANIIARITYKGNTYEVLGIGSSRDNIYPFQGCKKLTSVIIPNSVTSIGYGAFSGCSGLTSVSIPNSVTSIDMYAFWGCSGLTSIKVESGNTVYDSREDCNAIIKTATNTLLIGCNKTIIPNSVTSIGGSSFSGCSSMTSITIPNSVTSIDWQAFKDCSGLTSITIPTSVTSIDGAFWGCSGLTSITIPNSVKYIGQSSFRECSGLTSLTIPNSVTSIGGSAFSGCSGLASVKIEDGDTVLDFESFDYNPFAGCPVEKLYLGRTINYYSPFRNNKKLTTLIISNNVTSMADDAFQGCSGLTSVTIPNSVTSIGEYAFRECSGLTSIHCLGTTPPSTDKYAFSTDTYQTATLYVPTGSSSAYKNADYWKNFENIVEE